MQITHTIALDSFHNDLLSWYSSYGRKGLPWRNFARDGSYAYHIYISEIMLQQTQLTRVLESYYFPFLHHFPTLSHLAESRLEEVLYLWQGLGYYSRARNLHACATICAQQYNGTLPNTIQALRMLPGIGDYTAGAIMCFGFGGVAHFADSNIARVLQRLIRKHLTHKQILALAQSLLPQAAQVFDYHQAMIDIGALLCTKSPKCATCPISSHCASAFKPLESTTPRLQKVPLTLHLALCKKLDSIALCQSNENLYKGLYNLPLIANDNTSQSPLPTRKLLGSFTHSYTRYLITAHVYEATDMPNTHYYPLNTLPPISNLTKKALQYIPDTHSIQSKIQ